MKKPARKAHILVNGAGVAGYALLVTAWLLFIMAVIYATVDSSIISTSTDVQVIPDTEKAELSGSVGVFFYLLAIVATLIVLVIMIMLPYFLAKKMTRFIRFIMVSFAVPVTARNQFLVKSIITAIPMAGFAILALLYPPADMTLPTLHISTIFIGIVTLVVFFLQLVFARRYRVIAKNIW